MSSEGRLSHVELNVSDLAAAAEFYEWFLGELGYVRYQSWEQGRSWRRGDTYLVVVQVEEAHRERSFHRKGVGLNHLAFQAPNANDVDRMRAELVERGVAILYGGPRESDDGYALYFEGPDRLKLEYVWDRSAPA